MYKSEFHQAIAYIYPEYYYSRSKEKFYRKIKMDFGFERAIGFKDLLSVLRWTDKTGVPYRLHDDLKKEVTDNG